MVIDPPWYGMFGVVIGLISQVSADFRSVCSYSYFIKKGFPALLITVALAMVWLLIRFL